MNIDKFDEQVRALTMMVGLLQGDIRTRIPSARDILVTQKTFSEGVDPRQCAELELRKLSSRIDDLMTVHDEIYASIDMPPRYVSFLKQIQP